MSLSIHIPGDGGRAGVPADSWLTKASKSTCLVIGAWVSGLIIWKGETPGVQPWGQQTCLTSEGVGSRCCLVWVAKTLLSTPAIPTRRCEEAIFWQGVVLEGIHSGALGLGEGGDDKHLGKPLALAVAAVLPPPQELAGHRTPALGGQLHGPLLVPQVAAVRSGPMAAFGSPMTAPCRRHIVVSYFDGVAGKRLRLRASTAMSACLAPLPPPPSPPPRLTDLPPWLLSAHP